MKSVITAHNKKLLPENINTVPPCNCRMKNKFPLNKKCRTINASTNAWLQLVWNQTKFFLRTTEGDFKQRFNNHKQPLNNSNYHNDTQHSPNTLGTSKKNATKPQFCKDSSIIFKYNHIVFLVPPQKVRNIILS